MNLQLDSRGAEGRTQAVRDEARRLGFDLCGLAPARPPVRGEHFVRWLAEGMGGTMTYLNRSAERRLDPTRVLAGARTVISVGQSYFTGALPEEIRSDPARGLIAAYAWGEDYHDVMRAPLNQLAEFVRELVPGSETTCYVDSGPLLERDFGEAAGLGFIGKNTLLIHPRMGSQLFLGELLTTADFAPTPARPLPSCGSCTRCLKTCPTQAFPAAYVLDSRLCISYLTIEFKGSIPPRLREQMGNHVFGCDECQECCPWVNRFQTPSLERAYDARLERQAPRLVELAGLSEQDFLRRFARSPVLRPGYEGFMRNVAVAIGNWGTGEALIALEPLLEHESELVREHAEWARKRTRK